MNPQRLAVPIMGVAAVIGTAAVLAFAAGASGVELPGVPRPPVAAPTTAQPVADPVEPDAVDAEAADPVEPGSDAAPAEELASGPVDPSLLRGGIDPTGVPLAHLEWLTVIPELDPADPAFIPFEQREEHMIREQALARCMAGRGITYYPAAWWLNQDSQPRGLGFDESIAFTAALYGEASATGYDWSLPWTERGCVGETEHELEEAAAAGTVLTADVPEPDPLAPTPRQAQFVFQQAIERCMEEAGFEYLMPWDLAPGARTYPDGPAQYRPERPSTLDAEQRAAWDAQLDGDALPGAAYRWQDAGCSGSATHATGRDDMH
ncbi:hypothetical protein GCM10009819_17100 [Agromyces tropicus]|uniref:Uncharacterized protein n=1 Tax=Agromyces tropicus TaxID=555371 RepID=A0ABN2UB01_9MICO